MKPLRPFSFALLILTLASSLHADPVKPPIRDFLGICGHTVQFKPDLYSPVCSLVRDYHPVVWDLADKTQDLPPFPEAKNRVDWNQVYGLWDKARYRTDVCLMFDSIAPDHWHDLSADSSAYAKAFAKSFGPSSKRALVESVEVGNEPGNYSDSDYTSLLNAVVPAMHIADAKLRIATCNLTLGKSTKYAKSVSTLLDAPKALEAIDVLTIHTYAQAEPYPTWRRSYPEDPSIPYLKDVNDLAAWRDAHTAGKSIWITEFGYDSTTKKPDPKTEFAKWVGVTDTQQAQYLVRSALVFSAMPVQRAYIYFFDDSDEPHVHGSSGITRHFKPKPSYYALAHLQKTLGDFRFSRIVAETKGEIYAYEFQNVDSPDIRIIAAWSPTGSNRKASSPIAIPPGFKITRAERMPLSQDAVVDIPTVSADAIPLEESPIYLYLTREK